MTRWIRLAYLVGPLVLIVALATPVLAQGSFTAQIENFWRLISTGGRTFTTLSSVNSTMTGVLSMTGGGSTLGITLDNAEAIKFKDSGGTARSTLFNDGTNLLSLQNNFGGAGGIISFRSKTGGNASMTIDALGNVGIGNFTATFPLTVKDSIAITSSAVDAGQLAISAAVPGISGFAGSGPAASVITGSTVFSWRINVGGTSPGTTGTITLPTATNFWNCWMTDQTTPLDVTRQTSSTTAQVGITSTIAWTAGDILVGGCSGS